MLNDRIVQVSKIKVTRSANLFSAMHAMKEQLRRTMERDQ